MRSASELQFDPQPHIYRLDGRVIPGVTSVLSAAGMVSLPQFCDARVARKRMVGRDVHALCARLDLLGKINWKKLDPEIHGFTYAYSAFLRAAKPVWELVEAHVLIQAAGLVCGGTLDRAGMIFGEPWIVDLKTTAQAQPHWGLQLAGYSLGLNMPTVRPFRWRRGALILRRCGTFRMVEYADVTDAAVFLAALSDKDYPAVKAWKRIHAVGVEEEE